MHLLPFLAVSAVVVITPGVDMALVTKNALVHGRAAAQATAVGVNLGIFFWTIAAALGLAALVAASSTAFLALKLAGALYLIYLGLKSLRRSGERAEESLPVRSALSRRGAFLQGVASNLLNPKIAVFFTSLLPQFVDTGRATAGTFLVLGAIFNCMVALWLVSYAALAARGRALLVRPRVRLGARLAFERRR
jgi:threonine/homoserine/homoserine lactone efflux protein